jgi:hypothetical protein
MLREFRDRFLLTHSGGRELVRLYGRWSPALADIISRHESLRALVRWSLLPLVGVCYLALALGPAAAAALTLVLVAGLIVAVLFARRAVLQRVHAGSTKHRLTP